MKYRLIQEESPTSKVEHSFECDDLPDMLNRLRWFLAACSYSFNASEELVIIELDQVEDHPFYRGRKIARTTAPKKRDKRK